MRKWSKAPRILSLLAVMIAAAVGFAPAAHAAEGDVMIGDSAYASVPEAVKAIVDKKEPQGSTIKLTKDLTGPGVQVAGGQEFTFDLGGHTYTVTDPMVGSTGTETNAFQLMMGSNLTFRNGVITTESASGKILIQNYSNLKLEGVTLKGGPHTAYTLSNNNGNVTVGAGTNIYAGGAGPKAAFDVCRFADYESVVVTVEKGAGEIVGVIETSVFGAATGKGPFGLNINGGNLSNAKLVCIDESAEAIKVVKDPSVALAAPGGHEWVGGTLVKPSEKAVAAVVKPSGDVATFAKLADALAAADDATVQLLTDVTESVVIPADKTITLDLAGHTLSGGTAKGKAAITNNGALTIKDSSEDGSGRIIREDNGQPSYYVIDNQGTMTVESGTVYNNSGDYKSGSSLVRNGGVKNEAVLNIKGGTFEQEKFIVIKNDDYGILNMTGGVIKTGAPKQIDGKEYTSSGVQNWGQAVLSGGRIDGAIWTSAWSNDLDAPKTVITGDVSVKGDVILERHDKGVNKIPEVSIEGGQFEVREWKIDNGGVLFQISGGTYKGAIPNEDYIVPGSVLNKNPDGSFGVHKHVLVEVAEVPATCDKDGAKAHWKCKDCGDLYLDEGMKTPVTDPNTLVIAKLGHKATHAPAKPATVEAEGVVEHWYCAVCNTYFADAKLSKTMTKAETILAKLPKEFTVTFESGAGKPVAVVVKDGALLEEPAAPTLKGWKFLGWFKVKNADGTVAEKWDFAKDAVTADTTLYGGWVKDEPAKPAAKPTNKLPKTGDASMLPMIAAGISGVAALAAASKRRKH
ncbi:InlB B-repeat-containing protein [Collinsella intestinalis]|uniref:LPXTG cell wall anchor domain-containing protein n=1 Tax=Collinsella intestinalis TaxID=147207 RepID=A0A414FVP8_9ACTN|nr:InlB B-repeat-containing protein [Collinsella intestinalis]RHD55110.1 LPXTG cell wall anchor domain-containing protein [Collinsella intestinalis]